jgi:putative FmdB family regulatory protein
MPIYEYRCGACGHELEVLQKLSEPPLSDCPQCSKPALAKLISAVGFQLKGSGWYATDFKGNGKPAATADAKNGDGAAKSEAKSESGSESKSTAKAESSTSASSTSESSTSSGGCGGKCSCH